MNIEQQEAEALLSLVGLAKADVGEGNTMTSSEFKDRLEVKKQALESKEEAVEFKVGDWVVDNVDKEVGRVTEVDKTLDTPYWIMILGEGSCGAFEDLHLTKADPLEFRYLNYKGEQSWRKVIPLKTKFASSPYHNEGKPTWLLEAWDVDKDASRDFQMTDILELGKEAL